MYVLHVRNVHQALPQALRLLYKVGVERESRNGPVIQSSEPVTTVYSHPCERVIFWPQRDANPFFHLYESLWMLAGRNDVAGPARYAAGMKNYSDDGIVFHAAYGHRWRRSFLSDDATPYRIGSHDQLAVIAGMLKADPTDRRCVLQMWSSELDLGRHGKDLPCNDTATFQIGPDGRLNLVVFCRSNDIVWGAYGANAVHFSMLLEYMAVWIGVPVGTYTQVSVNWHGYLSTLEKLVGLEGASENEPYRDSLLSLPTGIPINLIDDEITSILKQADSGNFSSYSPHSWSRQVSTILYAHALHKTGDTQEAIKILKDLGDLDWARAGIEWLQRRLK